ncbi:hypothetical protein TSMEX_010383 [Taenia solium]|eukprot:TsM_000687000 transcript=TsM_000687000 gene=TsM_000687000
MTKVNSRKGSPGQSSLFDCDPAHRLVEVQAGTMRPCEIIFDNAAAIRNCRFGPRGYGPVRLISFGKMTPESVDFGLHEKTLESPRALYAPSVANLHRNHSLARRNWASSSSITTSNQAVGEMLQSTHESCKVLTASDSVACPIPSNDRQLRPTKLRLLRKSCEEPKTPLEPPTRVTANNALNGSVELADPANGPYYQSSETWNECVRCKKWRFFAQIHDPSEVSRVWDSGLQAKWKRIGVRGGLRHEEKEHLSERSMNANSDLYSEFNAGSLVWAKKSVYHDIYGNRRHLKSNSTMWMVEVEEKLMNYANQCVVLASLSLIFQFNSPLESIAELLVS